MPYIIAVNQPGYLPEQDPRAVADLADAIDAAHEHIGEHYADEPLDAEWSAFHHNADDLTHEGGVIGPLPDGYVIDVRRVSTNELAALCGRWNARGSSDYSTAQIIDAYNADR